MRLLLDENITPKVSEHLTPLGYDVVSVQTLNVRGIADFDLLRIAQQQGRILITHNGKHFIIQIPPKVPAFTHSGLFWLKSQLTRLNASLICDKIHDLCIIERNFIETIWILKNKHMIIDDFEFILFYPIR